MDFKNIMLIFGVALLYFGIRALIQYFNESKNYTVTTAVVVDYVKNIDNNNQNRMGYIRYTPVFEYTYNGKTYREEHRVSSSKYSKGMGIVPASKYSIGDTVEVRVYEKGEKVRAVINDENNIKLPLRVGVPFTIAGIVLVAAGIYFRMQ